MNKPSRNFLTREGHRRKPPASKPKVRTRSCPAWACRRLIRPDQMMCGQHWAHVPRVLQREVWQEYDASQKAGTWTGRYVELRQQALRAAEGARQEPLLGAD